MRYILIICQQKTAVYITNESTLKIKNPIVWFPPINTRCVQWFHPVSALYFSAIVRGYKWKPAFERWTCGESRYVCSTLGMLWLTRNILRFIILREPLLPGQFLHSFFASYIKKTWCACKHILSYHNSSTQWSKPFSIF